MTSTRTLSQRLPIAINTFVWHSPITTDLLRHVLPRIAQWGFEGVEVPLEDPGHVDAAVLGELLAQHGLTCAVGAVFGPGRELTAAAEHVVEATRQYVRATIDTAADAGSRLVIGPMYTSVGRTWRCTPDERAAILTSLREEYSRLGDYAGQRGVRLAVEPLNRYETSLLNTTEQVLDVIADLPGEVIGLNLDSYHMNIEEKSISAAIEAAGERLIHLQVCGNDRGAPGDDHFDWDTLRTALVASRYEGLLGIESFTADNETIATAASIWRPLAPTQDDLAIRGLGFLQLWREGWPST